MTVAYFLGGIVGAAIGTFLIGFLLRRFAGLSAWLASALAAASAVTGVLIQASVHHSSAIAQRISGGKEARLGLALSVLRIVLGALIAYMFLRGVRPREPKAPAAGNAEAD
jgi:hypothetical protein